MAVVKRVRKALESGGGAQPRSTRGLPLTARVAALSTSGGAATGRNKNNNDSGPDGSSESSEGEVVVLGTGRAIEKTLNVAAWFQKQNDCRVSLRTRSVAAVDDVVLGNAKNADGDWDADVDPDDADAEQEGDDEAEDHSRVRMVSCLEVAVRLR
jgi:ribonuclease P/MRP protein subunit POP7